MVNYIRTKDGIYEANSKIEPEKELQIRWIDDHCFETSWKTKPCEWKQADTVEELCDGFWWENKMYDEPIFIPNYQLALDRFNAWKQSDEALDSNCLANITLYGSIYIKGKGWSHVAKMDKEGKLCLI